MYRNFREVHLAVLEIEVQRLDDFLFFSHFRTQEKFNPKTGWVSWAKAKTFINQIPL